MKTKIERASRIAFWLAVGVVAFHYVVVPLFGAWDKVISVLNTLIWG